jgi:protein CpxP
MKTVTIAATAVVGLTLLGAVGAYAGMTERSGGEKRAYRFISMKLDNALDDVKATDAQRTQVNAVKDELFEQGKALKVGMEGSRGELKAQWLSQTPDRTKVHQIVDQRIDGLRDFAHKLADGMIRVHDIFTPEQRAQLSKMHEQRMEEHQQFHW